MNDVMARTPELRVAVLGAGSDDDQRGIAITSHLEQHVRRAAIGDVDVPVQTRDPVEIVTPPLPSMVGHFLLPTLRRHVFSVDHGHHPERVNGPQPGSESCCEFCSNGQRTLRRVGAVDPDHHGAIAQAGCAHRHHRTQLDRGCRGDVRLLFQCRVATKI